MCKRMRLDLCTVLNVALDLVCSLLSFSSLFLDASLHLYERVCLSICPSVGPLVRYASAKNAFLGCFWAR